MFPQKSSSFSSVSVLLIAAIGLLLLQAVSTIGEWIFQLLKPTDLDYVERWLAYIAQQAFPGGNHLTSATQMPYNSSPYPPLSYLIHGFFGRLLGGDLLTVRTIGRIITLAMTCLSGLLIVFISRVIGVGMRYSLLGASLFLVARPVHFFAVSLRPDEMACAFTLLGLLAILSHRSYWLAGAIFATALAAKYSFIAVPLALIVQLLMKRDFRSIAKFVGGGCIAGLIIVLLSNWFLGSYWWQTFTLQGLHEANLRQAIGFVGESFTQIVLIFGVASLFLVDFSGSLAIVAIAFLISLLLNTVAAAKVGAASNYFLEVAALGAILCTYTAQQIFERQTHPSSTEVKWRRFAWALLFALLISGTIDQTIKTSQTLKDYRAAIPPTQLLDLLRATKPPILADTASLYFDSQHTPYITPPDLMMAAVNGGKVDGGEMKQFIEDKNFNAIVLRQNWKEFTFYPRVWMTAIEQNYEPSAVVNQMLVMKPKKALS